MPKTPFYNPKAFVHPIDAIEVIGKALQYEFWLERAKEMVYHCADLGKGKFDYVRVVSVHPEWPRVGKIAIQTETKKQKFTFSLNKKSQKFTIKRGKVG